MKHLISYTLFENTEYREEKYRNMKSNPSMKYQLLEMDKKKFNDVYSKYKWYSVNKTRGSFKNNLFYLVNLAYDDIGGNVRINSPDRVSRDKDLNFWIAADINNDPYADQVIFGKKTQYGIKLSGFGHNGEILKLGKLFDKMADILRQEGFYDESSDKCAQIFLMKKVPIVHDINIVKKIFPDFGADAKFIDDTNTWYERTINSKGEKSKEILFGKPINV